MINCALVGFGRWGKIVYKSILKNKFLKLKYVCYNTKIEKNLIHKNIKITNNIDSIDFSKINLVFIAANPILNYKLCKFFLLKGKNIFIEKPIVTKVSELNEILEISKKLKLILHVDYIHLYNKNFIKFSELLKKNYNNCINQKLLFKFGSNGPIRKDLNSLWDWGPHVFSCLFYLLESLNKFKIEKMSINDNDYKGKLNFLIMGKYNSNLTIELLFGNMFKKKETSIIFTNKNNIYSYEDELISYNNKDLKNNNLINIKPLDLSINNLINKIKIQNYSNNKNSLEITKVIKKIEKKLLK